MGGPKGPSPRAPGLREGKQHSPSHTARPAQRVLDLVGRGGQGLPRDRAETEVHPPPPPGPPAARASLLQAAGEAGSRLISWLWGCGQR